MARAAGYKNSLVDYWVLAIPTCPDQRIMTFGPRRAASTSAHLHADAIRRAGVPHRDRSRRRGRTEKNRLELCDGLVCHPGGLAGDGKVINVPVSEYRPDSSALIYNVDGERIEIGGIDLINATTWLGSPGSWSRREHRLAGCWSLTPTLTLSTIPDLFLAFVSDDDEHSRVESIASDFGRPAERLKK